MAAFEGFTAYSDIAPFVLTLLAPAIVCFSWWLRRRKRSRSQGRKGTAISSDILAGHLSASAGYWDSDDQASFLHAMSANPDDEIVPPLTKDQRAAIVRLFREELAKLERGRNVPDAEITAKSSGATSILVAFVILAITSGIINVIHYWHAIRNRSDLMLWGFGLFVTMVGGMFVQVLSANYRSGKPLFAVYGSELAFPVLFSLVVFYPVWALTANGSQTMFSYYAAFLNGYFWQAIVSAARLPTGP